MYLLISNFPNCTKQEEFKKLNLFKIQIGRVLGKQFTWNTLFKYQITVNIVVRWSRFQKTKILLIVSLSSFLIELVL